VSLQLPLLVRLHWLPLLLLLVVVAVDVLQKG
jgi:hypothetical protein